MIPELRTFYDRAAFLKSGLLILLINAAASAVTIPLEPEALEYTHTRALSMQDPNLNGEGILIATVCRSMTYINDTAQNDYRFNMNHNSLRQSDVTFADGTDGRFGVSSHATAVAGILVGQDEAASIDTAVTFSYQGACPKASIDVYEFWRFATLQLFDGQPFEADILTLSLGEKYEDWWTRAIDNLAAEKDLVVVASIGNGQNDYDMLYPGAGANCIGVGVINAALDENDAASLYDFSAPRQDNSSSGPTSDQRCKPDIVAPGTALVPAYNSTTEYVVRENWSSLAAPVVSGTAALLLQKVYADDALADAFDQPGKNCVMKAVLLNSAAKLPYWHKGRISADDDEQTPLDFTQGAGALDAAAAFRQLTAGLQPPGDVEQIGWDNSILNVENPQLDYMLDAVEPNQMMTATLCWNYHYQNQYPFAHELEKDANLRLELWGIDPDTEIETLVAVCDSFSDNIEHLYVKSDERFSSYRLRVLFSDRQLPEDSTEQRYALAWSVGPDSAASNKWWHDLNGDDRIDQFDKFAFILIDGQIPNRLDEVFADQALNLSPRRLNLLTIHWQTWKTYLPDWQAPYAN